ncbi:TrbC/VirB2 family protein [Asticcacaulis sp. DW145]|uniref:TrbC/VirB2 family protein n=1 Tax=Asticcacaulis sp. DW145 TaxID=3095608 RepID=UPI00308EC74F|nr:TrbC/VirB2 family protein [Asticcacaulis sp. DW145]
MCFKVPRLFSSGPASMLALTAAFVIPSPAFAQIEKLTSVLENVRTAILGVGVVLFTIMIAWAGYKMGFQQARWTEVSNIVIGAVLVGGASAIAGWLIN